MGENSLYLLLLVALLTTPAALGNQIAEDFASQSASFAQDFYLKERDRHPNENIIISPFSVHTATSLAFIGAEGNTADQLVKGLHLQSSNKHTVAESFKSVLNARKDSSILKLANKIYLSPALHVKPEFLKIATEDFYSDVENINFADSEAAAHAISDWAEKNTNGKIKDLVQKSDIDGLTMAVLANAISFDGSWKYPFDKKKTEKQQFWLSENESVDIDSMRHELLVKYGYYEDIDATSVELPYANSDISMVLILPNELHGLEDLENKITKEGLRNFLLRPQSKIKVQIQIPKFKIDYSAKLKKTFKDLGMTSMFSDSADFRSLADNDLRVSNIIHKAFIDVNEVGTVAGAASAVVLMTRTGSIPFIADRPFLFLIKGASNEVYFMGRFVKP